MKLFTVFLITLTFLVACDAALSGLRIEAVLKVWHTCLPQPPTPTTIYTATEVYSTVIEKFPSLLDVTKLTTWMYVHE